MNFREWIDFCEQPHAYADKPVDFQLNGHLYQNIKGLDPRIEQWPDQSLKIQFFRYLLGHPDPENPNRKVPPQSIYFVDDNKRAFEIDNQNTLRPTSRPVLSRIMPAYWHHKAQFRAANDKVIDNMEVNPLKKLA